MLKLFSRRREEKTSTQISKLSQTIDLARVDLIFSDDGALLVKLAFEIVELYKYVRDAILSKTYRLPPEFEKKLDEIRHLASRLITR